jgi:hypothetical protein
MTRIAYDETSRLLCEYDDNDKVVYIWKYSDFEKYLGEAVTPSMYHFMSSYVFNHGVNTESRAVDAYFDLPSNIRVTMHAQELVNLQVAKREAEAKESAAIDAMLEENKPFDHTSPIAKEYSDFMRSIIDKNREMADRLENEIYEEEQWYGVGF